MVEAGENGRSTVGDQKRVQKIIVAIKRLIAGGERNRKFILADFEQPGRYRDVAIAYSKPCSDIFRVWRIEIQNHRLTGIREIKPHGNRRWNWIGLAELKFQIVFDVRNRRGTMLCEFKRNAAFKFLCVHGVAKETEKEEQDNDIRSHLVSDSWDEILL